MKKILAIILCCLIFTGCTLLNAAPTQTPSTAPSETTAPETIPIPETTIVTEPTILEIPVDIYIPDENAESFETLRVNIYEMDPVLITALLIEHSMLNDDIILNSVEVVDSQLNLDFNQAFMDQLCTYGTSGERMMIGCVVNTFLSVYEAECVYITVEGQIMESGHVIYDFPLNFFE